MTMAVTAVPERPHSYALLDGYTVWAGLQNILYMLRADDAARADLRIAPGGGEILYRFPWSDEDWIAPGAYPDPQRRARLWIKVTHYADCKGDTHYLKYERPARGGLLVPVLSCAKCGQYWAPEDGGQPSPSKAGLVAEALVTAARDDGFDAEVLRAAAVRVMQAVPAPAGEARP